MIRELSVQELKDWWQRSEGRPLVLDVREPWERQVCALADTKHVPMREVPGRLDELPRDGPIVVLCHHGNRSRQVAFFLAERDYPEVYNLRGGINAWAREVDPSMATY